MSHNKITVAGQSPNNSGEITLSVENLSDVTISSASDTQVLKYNGSAWVNSAAPSTSTNYMLIGQGETSAYSNSGASNMNQNSYLRIYDTSPINNISGASLTQYSSSNWYSDITLPAGKYFVQCQTYVEFSASGYLLFNLSNTSNNDTKSAAGLIGDNSTTYSDGKASTIQSWLNLTSSTTIGIRLAAVSNVDTVANQGNKISEHTYLLIMKIS